MFSGAPDLKDRYHPLKKYNILSASLKGIKIGNFYESLPIIKPFTPTSLLTSLHCILPYFLLHVTVQLSSATSELVYKVLEN